MGLSVGVTRASRSGARPTPGPSPQEAGRGTRHEHPPSSPARLGRRRADPAAQRRSGLLHLRPGRSGDRREPARSRQDSDRGRARRSRGNRLHALLRHQLHLHRPRRRDLLPRRPVQHRRRGPGLRRGVGSGARGALSRLPARIQPRHRGDRRGGAVRRCLRRYSRLSPGQARQPYRHHDDHVQLTSPRR